MRLSRSLRLMIEQCVSLPGETSQIVRHYLRKQGNVSGRAKSVLELLLLRLDEQGLDISSPWRISGGDLIVSVLWPMQPGSAKSNGQAAERLMRMCEKHGSRLSFV